MLRLDALGATAGARLGAAPLQPVEDIFHAVSP
jgi:hypothetical protein